MKTRPSTWWYGIVKSGRQDVCFIPSLHRNSEKRILVVPIVPSRAWSQRHITEDSEEPDKNVAFVIGLEYAPLSSSYSYRQCLACSRRHWRESSRECWPCAYGGLDNRHVFLFYTIQNTRLTLSGWSGGVLSEENDFYDLVEAVSILLRSHTISYIFVQHVDKPLRVYVYSYDFEFVNLYQRSPQCY